MRPEERDLAYLWDMLDAARTALEFTRGTTFYDYDRDRKLQLAVERLVEIVKLAWVDSRFDDSFTPCLSSPNG